MKLPARFRTHQPGRTRYDCNTHFVLLATTSIRRTPALCGDELHWTAFLQTVLIRSGLAVRHFNNARLCIIFTAGRQGPT
jgi:hypothetical protein